MNLPARALLFCLTIMAHTDPVGATDCVIVTQGLPKRNRARTCRSCRVWQRHVIVGSLETDEISVARLFKALPMPSACAWQEK